ncbi:hypothetical protein BX666DRAFT_1936525 [Dichotomocladium elegans]|nr:hypothetical protein BX666DRAFT_1936525 [Dichotomocladium elegans]
MPRTLEYLNGSPQGMLRQIILVQISIAFFAVFLIIATAKPNQYRSKTRASAPFSSPDTNPYTIFTASDHAPSLLAFVYSIWCGSTRPSIILFTSSEQTVMDVREGLRELSEIAIDGQHHYHHHHHAITIIPTGVHKDNSQSLWKAALAESIDEVVVWIDPQVRIANAHLLAQLPRLVHQEGGRWGICTSETICTILGLNTTAALSFYRNFS